MGILCLHTGEQSTEIERIKYIRSLLAMAPRIYRFLLSILLDEWGLRSELLRFA
jgi:hypothetical protein